MFQAIPVKGACLEDVSGGSVYLVDCDEDEGIIIDIGVFNGI